MSPRQLKTSKGRLLTPAWEGTKPARMAHAKEARRSQKARHLKRQAERDAKAEWQGKFASAAGDELEGKNGGEGKDEEVEGDEDGGGERKQYCKSGDETEAEWWDNGVKVYGRKFRKG